MMFLLQNFIKENNILFSIILYHLKFAILLKWCVILIDAYGAFSYNIAGKDDKTVYMRQSNWSNEKTNDTLWIYFVSSWFTNWSFILIKHISPQIFWRFMFHYMYMYVGAFNVTENGFDIFGVNNTV